MTFFAKSALAAAMALVALAGPALAQGTDPANTLVITTRTGDIEIALRPDLAPQHVERIKELATAGAYDNVVFHRVIDGFMAQTGDVEFGNTEEGFTPEMAGTGGSDLPDLEAEFSEETFDRGTVGMARSQDPNSANSQFFIMLADNTSLDGQYTVVGDVVSGMEHVDEIKKGDSSANGAVEDPDKMVDVEIAAGQG